MPQISHIKYKDILEANRIDAEYFRPFILKLISKIESGKFSRIGNEFDVTKLAGFEYTKYFTKQNIESDDFYIALTSLNIQNENLVDEGALKIDRKIANEFLTRSKLYYGDVVLSYTGEYRRCLTILDNSYQLGPNICLIRNTTNLINSFYLSTFLNSKIGQTILDREKTLSGQPTVAMSRIRTIAVPILEKSIQLDIEKIILTSKQKQSQSKQLYKEAEVMLLEELGLLNYEVKHSLWFSTTKKEIDNAKRYDSEYFQPKYAEMVQIISKNAKHIKTIENIKTYNNRGLQPIYNKDGLLNVINSKHILDNTLDYDNFEKTDMNFWEKQKKARVFEGDILIYTTGANIGRTQVYSSNEKAMASNHVNILRIIDENPYYVGFVMNSLIGKLQTEKLCAGSAQVELYPKDIDKFIIPFISIDLQNIIVNKLKESHKLRKESKDLLEEAKRKVEEEIEKG